ncbi:MAG: alginate O-acetyltransferase AlgX-related protein [Rhodoferax sp.]
MPSQDFPDNKTAGPSRYAALAALTLSCVMLVGAWQMVAALSTPDGLQFPRSWTDFVEGRSTATLEKQLDQKLPARTVLITVANSVRYLLTGSGGEQVRAGRDGWLFLAEELRFEPDGIAHLRARAELLGAATRALDQQGVKLIVALVPDKARVYADKLAGGRYPGYNSSRYQDALYAFHSQGVATVDLLKPLTEAAVQSEVYYRSDTHWNQAGAQIAAHAFARAVQQLGVDLDKTTFSSSKVSGPVERSGDLIRLMGLEDAPRAIGPSPDLEAPMVTRQITADNAGGLFGDSTVPVVLTGTSYSSRGNFHGFLQQALSAQVLNASKDGGGFLQSITAYLNDEAFHSSKPKVLVWELPERFLHTKLNIEPRWLQAVNLRP